MPKIRNLNNNDRVTSATRFVGTNSTGESKNFRAVELHKYITGMSGDVGEGKNIINAYFVSQSSGDLEQAVTATKALNTEFGKSHILVIDVDVNITGSPRVITVDVPVIVQRGFKIITPEVERDYVTGINPIEGTVAENYIEVRFSELFHADRDAHVFEGDGLIRFRNRSVDCIYVDWWGIIYNSQTEESQSSNVIALQKAIINTVTLSEATKTLRFNSGRIYLNSPVVVINPPINSHPFLTGKRLNGRANAAVIKLEGAEPIKHEFNTGNATSIYYTAKWGAFIMLQGLRNASITNLRIEGNNRINARDNEWKPEGYSGANVVTTFLRPDFFGGTRQEIIDNNYWIEPDVFWQPRTPYAAIVTDPFRTDKNSGGYRKGLIPESTVDLYYWDTTQSHQNSWAVNLERMHMRFWVEGIVNTLEGQQGDTYIYREIMFDQMCIGISTVQDQARDCKAYEIMAYNGIWAMFDTITHKGTGILPEVMSAHSAGGLKYIHVGDRYNGIINISNIYAESVYAFGLSSSASWLYNGETNAPYGRRYENDFPATINNCTIKYEGICTYTVNGETCYLKRPPVIQGFTITNSLIGVYGGGLAGALKLQDYTYCNVSNLQGGVGNANLLQPFDAGWWRGKPTLMMSDGLISPSTTYSAPVGNTIGEWNTGFHSGKLFEPTYENPAPFELVNYSFGEVLYRRIDSDNISCTLNSTANTLTYNKGIDYCNVGDIVMLQRISFQSAGIVVSKAENSVTIGAFGAGYEKLLELGVGTNGIGVTFTVLKRLKSFYPFYAEVGSNNNELNMITSAAMFTTKSSDTNFSVKPSKDDVLILGDGEAYYIKEVVEVLTMEGVVPEIESIITLDRDYSLPQSDGFWVECTVPNYKTTSFFNIESSNGVFNKSSFYKKGERYDYFEGSAGKTPNYVICTKTGDFSDATDGSTKASLKANFLLYDSNGSLLSYISGEETVYPMTSPKITDFNRIGDTASRPDNTDFPNEYIPNGFAYINTELSSTQIWNGDSFVSI